MSKEKRRVPKLRFPGFTEDWEQRKLGEIFEYLQNNTLSRDSLNYKIPNIKNIHYGDILVKFNEILDGSNKDIPYINPDLDLSKFSKSLLRDGDVIFSDTAEDDTVGKAIELQNVNAPFILSGLHTIPCRPLIPFGKGYLGNFFNSNSYRLQIRPLVQGIKVSSISKSALKDTMIKYPKNLDEQEKIGSLFQSITKMITLHQRKLNNLKLKRKALLQKLFPKNGEGYPELRFPGFTDAWEQRKFGELFILKSGVAFKLSEYTKTGIPIINGESIKAGKISLEKINYLPNEYQYKYQECLLFPGDIVLGLNRPIIDGTLKISRIPADIKKSLLYQRAGKIIFKVNMDENFTYQLLSKEVLTFTKKEAVGSDQPFITTTKLNKWDLYFPVKDKERRNIGSLFNNIDNIITLHQRKLDHLQLQKKALLQQMFV